MPHQPRDIRVEVKVRNNLVLSRMEQRGIGTVAELCRRLNDEGEVSSPQEKSATKVWQVRLGRLINMKEPARKEDGEWLPLAIRLADFFKCMPEELFSDPQQYGKLDENRAHAEVAYAEIQQLTARNREPVTPELTIQADQLRHAIGKALATLTPREERILRMRFGFDGSEEMTLEAIGKTFGGMQRETIRQIEAKALRKLKHPSRLHIIIAAGGSRMIVEKDYGKQQTVYLMDEEVVKAL